MVLRDDSNCGGREWHSQGEKSSEMLRYIKNHAEIFTKQRNIGSRMIHGQWLAGVEL